MASLKPRDDGTPIIGRERERRALAEALRGGRSVWVHGARGVGKSALVRAVAASWDPKRENAILLYAADCSTRKALLRGLLESLFGTLGFIRPPSSSVIRSPDALRRFVTTARRRQLNDALHRTLAGRPTIRALDHLDARGARLETHVENLLFESTPVVLVTVDQAELGPVDRLLFAFESLEVPALSRAEAEALAALWLPTAPCGAWRELVRHASGNPGRLHELALLARKEKYWLDGRLNFLRLDFDSKIAAIARGAR
jgi:hypothetical protein